VLVCCFFGLIDSTPQSKAEAKDLTRLPDLFDDVNAECRGIGACSVLLFQGGHLEARELDKVVSVFADFRLPIVDWLLAFVLLFVGKTKASAIGNRKSATLNHPARFDSAGSGGVR
jgi:hypothetical protein